MSHIQTAQDYWGQLQLYIEKRSPSLRYWVKGDVSDWEDIYDFFQGVSGRKPLREIVTAFGRAKSPEMARFMLRLSLVKKTAEAARTWLRKNPQWTIEGLIPIAGEDDRAERAALKVLKEIALKGNRKRLKVAIAQQPDVRAQLLTDRLLKSVSVMTEDVERLDDASTPSWLREAIEQMPSITPHARLPRWLPIEILPILRIEEGILNPTHMRALVIALQNSSLETAHPLVIAIKQHLSVMAAETLATALFERWQKEDMPAQNKWVLWAAAHLGSDMVATKLGPVIVQWRKQLKHVRIEWGLDTLVAMDSDAALMQLHYISQKAHRVGLREKAEMALLAVAARRGLSRIELADRIVPDCGLDAVGQREFDFGRRRFQVVLGADMKPIVRDEAGKLRANLPKAGKQDDGALAGESITAWRSFKKQLSSVVKVQSSRLEQAMITGRGWSAVDFEKWLIQHPLMFHLTQRLLWTVNDAENELTEQQSCLFRVSEDKTYADINDEQLTLQAKATVSLVHPLNLSETALYHWQQVWSDYELFPPFEQLDRGFYQLTSEEKNRDVITRCDSVTVPALSLMSTLEARGWEREADGYECVNHWKMLFENGCTAQIFYDGSIYLGDIRASGDLKKIRCRFFSTSLVNEIWQHQRRVALPLDQVDPIVISEVIRDLSAVAAKAIP